MNVLSSFVSRFRRFDKGGSISGTLLVNFGGAGFTAISSVIFARILGLSEFGLYVYVISAIGLVGSLASLGLPTLVTRQVAAWGSTGDWLRFNGIIRFSILATLVSAAAFGLFLVGGSGFLGKVTLLPHFRLAMALGVAIMIIQALDTNLAATLQGMHFVARSLVPQSLVLPLCLIAYSVATIFLHTPLDAVELLTAQLLAGLLLLAYQFASLAYLRPQLSRGKGHEISGSAWLRNSLPFLGNGILFVVNTQADTILLGYFKGGNSAAIYQVGTRGAQLVVLSLGAIVTAIQPRLASLHVAGDQTGIARLVTHTTRLGFLVALAGAAFLMLFGGPIIRLLYGPAFGGAVSVLFILILARLVNASVGSLGPYLTMTGKEHLFVKALAGEAVGNILLNLLLIPKWGMNGSAFATGISMSISNLVMGIYVYRKWAIDTSILGLMKKTD